MTNIFGFWGRGPSKRRMKRQRRRRNDRCLWAEGLERRALLTATLSANSAGVVDFLSQTTSSTVTLSFDSGTDTYTFQSTEGVSSGGIDTAFTYNQVTSDKATLTPVDPSTQDFSSLAFDQNAPNITYAIASLGTATMIDDGSLVSSGGTDTINLGSTGLAGDFTQSVAVELAKESAAITIDDSADSSAKVINMSSNEVNFNATPAFSYSGTDVTSLVVKTGTANNTVNVAGTPLYTTTTVDFGAGNNTVNVMAAGVAAAPPALTLNGGAGTNTLYVNLAGTNAISNTAGTITLANEGVIDYSHFSTVQFVNNPPAITPGSAISAVVNVPVGNAVIATFTDADTIEGADSYTATIDWGDSTSSAGTITFTGTSMVGGLTVNDYSISGTHTYVVNGTQTTEVALTDLGGTFTLSGGGTITLPPLSPITTAGATINVGVNVLLAGPLPSPPSGTVGTQLTSVPLVTFTDNPSPLGTTAYSATIDWGDGSPFSFGAITFAIATGLFTVSGTHTYAAPGIYPISVLVVGDNQQLTQTTSATIAAPTVPLSIDITPQSVTGITTGGNTYTSNTTPTFAGTTSPGATVSVFATPTGSSPLEIAGGTANSAGYWSATVTPPLGPGSYTITAEAFDSSGAEIGDAALATNLVIDVTPPVITAMTFNRFTDTVTVTYESDLSGMNYASIGNSAFYHLSAKPLAPKVPVPKLLLPTSITITPVTSATDPETTVTIVFNHGHSVRGGYYLLVINSGTGNSGVHDNAGNALSGFFYGTFPTGNGLPGGNFAAAISTYHNHIVLKPVPVQDGYVAPGASKVGPAPKESTTAAVVRATPAATVMPRAVPQTGAHDLAIEALTFDEKKDKRRGD